MKDITCLLLAMSMVPLLGLSSITSILSSFLFLFFFILFYFNSLFYFTTFFSQLLNCDFILISSSNFLLLTML